MTVVVTCQWKCDWCGALAEISPGIRPLMWFEVLNGPGSARHFCKRQCLIQYAGMTVPTTEVAKWILNR